MFDLAEVLLHIAATNPKVDARTDGPRPLIAGPVRIRQILGCTAGLLEFLALLTSGTGL
jgi:hypothetical protein